MMTFEEFQASRVESADLGKAIDQPEYFQDKNGVDRVAVGYVYDGGCYIERLSDGRFYLIIFNEQWINADLGELEATLYEFCVDNLLFD